MLALVAALQPALLAAVPPNPIVVVRVFALKHRRAEEAALLVRPLRTDAGSVIVESRLNTLTVRDTAQAVERIAQAIASYDIPPRGVSISMTLLRASAEAPKSGAEKRDVSAEIQGVGEKLKKLFNFTGYTPLDSVVVEGTEGDAVAYAIGGEFRLEFLLESSADETIVRMRNLRLERVRRDPAGREVRREILRTSLNVPIGQTYVLGIGKDESATGALFLVFYASWRGPGPGIVGVR